MTSRHVRVPGLCLAAAVLLAATLMVPSPAGAAVNTAAPTAPVKLIFIHHSTGQAWLADGHGRLGIALRDNNYFVSDTNYGWGPDAIGDRTDLGQWWSWFRGPSSPTYLSALYAESGQHSSYSRLATDPGGPNEIVMFKSCFPNSQLNGPYSPIPGIADNPMKGQWCGGDAFTVANAKGIYIDLLACFSAHPEKLFVAVVAPPVTSPDTLGGRVFADWLVDHWLQDSAYTAGNVLVFDLYNVLTSRTGGGASDVGLATGNHHRIWNGSVQHKTDDGADRLAYPSAGDDSHPNAAGAQKATAEFVPLLNNAYNAWRGNIGGDTTPPVTSVRGHDDAWHKLPVTLVFNTADPAPDPSGVKYTESRVDAGAWVQGTVRTIPAPGDHAGDGVHTVSYRSLDNAGNTEAEKFLRVKIDTTGPTTTASNAVTVRRGKTADFRFEFTDVSPAGVTLSPTSTVKIVISKGGLTVRILRVGACRTGVALAHQWRCTLKAGTYAWSVLATDEAGNRQAVSGRQSLRVM
jgi:hypothetical protein